MKEVMEFIFQDWWHFLGTCLLLMIIFDKPFITISSINNRTDKSQKTNSD